MSDTPDLSGTFEARDFSTSIVGPDPRRTEAGVERLARVRDHWVQESTAVRATGANGNLEQFIARRLDAALLIEQLRVQRDQVRRAVSAATSEWATVDPAVIALAEQAGAGRVLRGLESAMSTIDSAWSDVETFAVAADAFACAFEEEGSP